jgi:act minimal PKS acyl carrier protein
MSLCTIGELTELMRDTLGGDEAVDLSGDIRDVPLSDLGFDSLAKLELAASLRHRFGVTVPDDVIEGLATPRDALALVNGDATVAVA